MSPLLKCSNDFIHGSGTYVTSIPIVAKRCFGLAVNARETLMAVANFDHRGGVAHTLFLYSLPSGDLLRIIGGEGDGPGQFRNPNKLCFHPCDDAIIVADYGNDRLQEFTSTGEYKRSIVVDKPWSVCVSNKGGLIAVGTTSAAKNMLMLLDNASGLLVHDFTNARFERSVHSVKFSHDDAVLFAAEFASTSIHMFSITNGTFIRQTCQGLSVGNKDVALMSNGDIVVVECSKQRMCVFDGMGVTTRRQFGCKGDDNGQFQAPVAISIVNRRLYVLDAESQRVQVFV